MKLETILYSVGGLFAMATIIYFSWEFIINFSRIIKAILLALLVFFFIFLSVWLKERDI